MYFSGSKPRSYNVCNCAITSDSEESISLEFTLFLKDIFHNQLKEQGFGQSCALVIAGQGEQSDCVFSVEGEKFRPATNLLPKKSIFPGFVIPEAV